MRTLLGLKRGDSRSQILHTPAGTRGLRKAAECRSVERMFVNPVAIKALQNMLGELETLISTTTPLPENRTARCIELLATARALTNDMVKRGSRVH